MCNYTRSLQIQSLMSKENEDLGLFYAANKSFVTQWHIPKRIAPRY